jgi:small-conductance mechanosensitive channel
VPELTSIRLPDWVVLVLQVALIVVVALVALRLARTFVHGVFQTLIEREAREGRARDLSKGEIQRRMNTLDSLGANMLQLLIVVIAALMILGLLGIDIGPAIAGLGIVGIAIGFGAQSLVRDYFNGVLILIENQYDKGDVVRIAGVEGTVEDLTLRRTTLRDFAGNVHTVPIPR